MACVSGSAQIEALKAAGCERVYSERASPGADSRSLPRARARRVRFGPPDRLSPLGEVYLQPTLTAGHGTGEGGSRERGGEKMVWEPDRFNAQVAHRLRSRPRHGPIKAPTSVGLVGGA